MKKKMGLVYGGKSPEHNVSLQTAKAVIKALDLTKYDVHPIYITENGEWIRGKQLDTPVEDVQELRLENGEAISPMAINPEIFSVGGETDGSAAEKLDIVFPLLHGPNGEDGTVQGLLELLNIPYVGNGVLASAAGMDKVMMKNVYDQAGIKQPAYVWFLRGDWEDKRDPLYANVEETLGYPCFVKPANLGSSVGISKARNRAELDEACATAFAYDRKIIIEEGIDGREIEMAVLGNNVPECSVVGEIKPETDFYDYKAKYEDGSTGLIIPAEISESEYEEMKNVAVRSFKALDCAGLVRADFFLTEAGDVLMNEVNTMPGFTPVSMFPMLWQKSGLSYPELIERLVQLGLERYEEKQKIKHTF